MEEEGSFSKLPKEIFIDILSRLPIRSIITCKCVCKSWLELLNSVEFVKYHRSKSVPWLTNSENISLGVEVFKPISAAEVNAPNFSSIFGSKFPHRATLVSSVNGMLFLHDWNILYICNPITREYIRVPPNPLSNPHALNTYGFGLSKSSGQYKLAMITDEVPHQKAYIYTLGEGCWRSIVSDNCVLSVWKTAVFVNGKLYWANERSLICYLDLETEVFTTFPGYPCRSPILYCCGDSLCLIPIDMVISEIVSAWVMKEEGDDISWTKEKDFKKRLEELNRQLLYCYWIKIVGFMEDGQFMLRATQYGVGLCSSTNTDMFESSNIPNYRKKTIIDTQIFPPSIKSLGKENVLLF